MKKIIGFIFLFFYISVFAQEVQPRLIATYKVARLYQQNGIYIIDVRGSYEQMGEQYGTLLKKPLEAFYNAYDQELKLNHFLRQIILWVREKMLPQEERDFLRGESKASGLSIEHLMLLDHAVQMVYVGQEASKIGLGCSVICSVGPMTQSGEMIIARNFDWLNVFRRIMTPYLTVAIFHPNQGNAFATLSYVGSSLSAVTAMNEKGLFIELNSAISSVGPYVRAGRPSYFAQMMQMMQNSNTFADLRHFVMTTPPDEAYTLTIADAKQSASIEVTSAPFVKNFAKERNDLNQNSVYSMDKTSKDFVIATNTYRAPGWSNTVFADAYPTYSRTQSFERYDNLHAWAMAHAGKITPALARQILLASVSEGGVNETSATTPATDPYYTYYSIVAIPGRLEWQIKAGDSPNPWTYIDLGNYYFD